jgi:hypothetical protein
VVASPFRAPIGRKGWELVGVTGKHTAFERQLATGVSR